MSSANSVLQVEMTYEQAAAVKVALDVYARLCLGQLNVVKDMIAFEVIPVCNYDKTDDRQVADISQISTAEELLNQVKVSMGYPLNGSLGIHHDHVHISGKRAWEVMRAIAKPIAVKTNPRPEFKGVDFQGLLVRCTPDPAPVALDVPRLNQG